jgi:hypothetical protein
VASAPFTGLTSLFARAGATGGWGNGLLAADVMLGRGLGRATGGGAITRVTRVGTLTLTTAGL